MKRFFSLATTVVALILLGSANMQAQNNDPVIDKVIELGQTDNHTTEWVDILCNRFGGRLVGSDA